LRQPHGLFLFLSNLSARPEKNVKNSFWFFRVRRNTNCGKMRHHGRDAPAGRLYKMEEPPSTTIEEDCARQGLEGN